MQETVTTNAGEVEDVKQYVSTIHKASLIALLLTGSVEEAENTVLEAIALFEVGQDAPEALLMITIAEAVRRPSSRQTYKRAKGRSSMLPWQLSAVLYLSPQLRHCYILRILLGWSREISADLLGIDTTQVDECTRTAVVRLARIHKLFEQWNAKSTADSNREEDELSFKAKGSLR